MTAKPKRVGYGFQACRVPEYVYLANYKSSLEELSLFVCWMLVLLSGYTCHLTSDAVSMNFTLEEPRHENECMLIHQNKC